MSVNISVLLTSGIAWFSTSGSQHVGHNQFEGLNDLYTELTYQISYISDNYVAIHENSKITVTN